MLEEELGILLHGARALNPRGDSAGNLLIHDASMLGAHGGTAHAADAKVLICHTARQCANCPNGTYLSTSTACRACRSRLGNQLTSAGLFVRLITGDLNVAGSAVLNLLENLLCERMKHRNLIRTRLARGKLMCQRVLGDTSHTGNHRIAKNNGAVFELKQSIVKIAIAVNNRHDRLRAIAGHLGKALQDKSGHAAGKARCGNNGKGVGVNTEISLLHRGVGQIDLRD